MRSIRRSIQAFDLAHLPMKHLMQHKFNIMHHGALTCRTDVSRSRMRDFCCSIISTCAATCAGAGAAAWGYACVHMCVYVCVRTRDFCCSIISTCAATCMGAGAAARGRGGCVWGCAAGCAAWLRVRVRVHVHSWAGPHLFVQHHHPRLARRRTRAPPSPKSKPFPSHPAPWW